MPDRTECNAQQSATLARIQLLVLDVDGTLTDGQVTYGNQAEWQSFCVRDGQGLVWLRKHGIQVAWITGRGCEATRRRAEELGVEELHIKSGPKREVLRSVQQRLGVNRAETLSMGDDLPDLALAAESAFFAAPSDARAEVRRAADWISNSKAGHGAVRELAELLLQARGAWDELVHSYGAQD